MCPVLPGRLPEVPTVSIFGTGYPTFISGSSSEVSSEVPTCPVLPGPYPEAPTQLFNIWENHNLINIGSNLTNDIPK